MVMSLIVLNIERGYCKAPEDFLDCNRCCINQADLNLILQSWDQITDLATGEHRIFWFPGFQPSEQLTASCKITAGK